ncbi:BfmA/BtgA family mobilization protein [Maribacter polysaccharolyticus]|uniref:BfmA/BtgA family mobilization protein n=1 Tax=Maribacter polysaccharolyticus TaxID=3020831 RepID=UPI00237F54F2|nr:BfmA/BtgA family mobilization protein [Maribacter polysaccharolyticus]MDE3742101.1 BfmA/BtgA family mobilization protein [Maribacter polysaccharolyticus]
MEEYSKYNFSAINVKKDIASRFRDFSKQISKSNTEALEAMLNFFDWNDLSPHDNLGVRNDGTKKRINALIAIVKNIEKNGINPTKAMMQLLFEQVPPKDEEPDLIEIGPQETVSDMHFQDAMEAIELRKERNNLKNELEETRKKFGAFIFERVKETRTGFGKSRLYLDMNLEEFRELQSKYKNQ